jgi:hypothetical protein
MGMENLHATLASCGPPRDNRLVAAAKASGETMLLSIDDDGRWDAEANGASFEPGFFSIDGVGLRGTEGVQGRARGGLRRRAMWATTHNEE